MLQWNELGISFFLRLYPALMWTCEQQQ